MDVTRGLNKKNGNTWKVSVGNPEGRRRLGRVRRKWEDIIQVRLK